MYFCLIIITIDMLKVVLVILLIYFGIKILSRIFAPLLLKYLSKKATQRFGGQFGSFQKQKEQQPTKAGEISIDKMPENKSTNSNVGEYVDYEEVE